MQFDELVEMLLVVPYFTSRTTVNRMAEKLIEKPNLFHDWELNKVINNKKITFKFTISINGVSFLD